MRRLLVGLQFVYSSQFEDDQQGRPAVMLSGNGPLVKVLQHALDSKVFVQDVHGFLKQYGGESERLPEEHIWVYDEAQRAWDAERVQAKRNHDASEPEDFLGIGQRRGTWALMVGLIGEGQEIHIGEEAGLRQWNEAIQQLGGRWHVHCPDRVAHIFQDAARVAPRNELDLTASLRTHVAEDVQRWISELLVGNPDRAAKYAATAKEQGYDLYVTRSLDVATNYVKARYAGEEDKRYGLLSSSKGKIQKKYGVQNGWNYTRNLRHGPWYNDPPSSRFSSCQLRDVATEFACQGLELDFPIVTWGDDLTWDGHTWRSVPQPRSKAADPHQLRLNSYRVLLSRGRDGVVVFVPPDAQLDTTYEYLLETGMRSLSEPEDRTAVD